MSRNNPDGVSFVMVKRKAPDKRTIINSLLVRYKKAKSARNRLTIKVRLKKLGYNLNNLN